MLIRIAVAISNKIQEKKLILKLTGISIVMKVEFDISIYSDCFDKLIDNVGNTDIIISDFILLQKNNDKLSELYIKNSRCLPVLFGENREKISEYLVIRPVEYIDDIENIKPENENDKIKKVCDFFIEFVNRQLENKSDNSVLYITTKKGSHAISKDSILYCQSDLKYTVFVIDNGMIIRKLGKLQSIEEKYLWDFKRIHQSFLVNPEKVKSIDKTTNEIILTNDIRIPFSRKYVSAVRELFNNRNLHTKNEIL